MADFKIVQVFEKDCQMVVQVEHNHADGSFWHLEHYVHQGREGLRQKRATTRDGIPLMDNDQIAPLVDIVEGAITRQDRRLPPGRTWKLRPGPHLDDDSILETIREIHSLRLLSGWPQGSVDKLSTSKHSDADKAGCPSLTAHFQRLVGVEGSL
jgi:hypothetical protein